MGEEESITVAEVSEGDDAGAPVDLPVVELLTGRAFLTGKSGSGKSNTASVVVERLLDRGFGVLIVDIEGEYYGLKEEYEILHAGADEECDIQVSEEHAGKLASLALEQNVPIILDLSGFIDEKDGRDLLKAVARQLFAKEKKVKQPFLMVVEEIHEYVPEGGGMDECGRMLVKVAKRGRKHGLGVAGISQRPADVKKDFITQCDWLVWHRLTWQNDTRVVKRVLGSDYADAIEDMDDGEGFLMTDWGEDIRKVQFHRKETFDAGATPGLEDFERPDLKSVSDDLVSELQTISEQEAAREDDIARLENELEEREQRIAELKEELAEARDLSDMAEQFARAMTAQAEPRSEPSAQRDLAAYNGAPERERPRAEPDDDATQPADGDDVTGSAEERVDGDLDDRLTDEQRAIIRDAADANEAGVGDVTIPDGITDARDGDGGLLSPPDDDGAETDDEETQVPEADDGEAQGPATDDGEAQMPETDEEGGQGAEIDEGEPPSTDETPEHPTGDGSEDDESGVGAPVAPVSVDGQSDAATNGSGAPASNGVSDPVPADDDGAPATSEDGQPSATAGEAELVPPESAATNGHPSSTAATERGPEAVAASLRERVADLKDDARLMLAAYRDTGVATPEAVHEAVGGSGDRPAAYSHNRALRREGFVVHVGSGRYAYSLPSLVAARTDADLDDDKRRQLVGEVEAPLSW